MGDGGDSEGETEGDRGTCLHKTLSDRHSEAVSCSGAAVFGIFLGAYFFQIQK